MKIFVGYSCLLLGIFVCSAIFYSCLLLLYEKKKKKKKKRDHQFFVKFCNLISISLWVGSSN